MRDRVEPTDRHEPTAPMGVGQALLVVGAFIASYVALDWVSYIAPIAPFGITPWNPPPALSIALLLFFGVRFWPALFLATLAAEYVVRGLPAPLLFNFLIAGATSLGYVGAALALRRLLPPNFAIVTRRNLLAFLAVVACFALPVAATYVFVLTSPTLLPREDLWRNILLYWVGDVIGIITLAPLLLTIANWRPERGAWTTPRLIEAALQLAAIFGALWIVFGVQATDEFRFFYVLFLPVIWVALRHGILGAEIAILAVQIGLVVAVETVDHPPITVLELQMLMLTLAVTGLFLGVLLNERSAAVAALRARDDEFAKMMRMAALSEMSSALAHELNQPLAAVSNYVRAANLMLDQGVGMAQDPLLLRETLVKAVGEVERAGKVIHRLRDFYRAGGTKLERATVEDLVREAVQPLQLRLARRKIAVELNLPKQPVHVMADKVQLAAVIYNLVANAIDALGADDAGAGVITIGATARNGQVDFTVSDTGPGLSPDIGGRVFDAFATTKTDGLGLGLTISKSIVEAHGGHIAVRPGAKGGAEFAFSIPAVVEGAQSP
ncbi:MAG: MASE1 domain-containing protein [Rhodospirillaceae bacterium]|nr:MASE1 domain-containing protein [Rhodospirillaceae bacterium]